MNLQEVFNMKKTQWARYSKENSEERRPLSRQRNSRKRKDPVIMQKLRPKKTKLPRSLF
jgi:hypothetical protein